MTEAGYFESMFAGSDDPWGHSSRWYEQRKYGLTLAALPNRTYASCFEPACGIGVLTADLARRCDSVLAWDSVQRAVDLARRRTRETATIVECHRVPDEWPTGEFDLVVISELLYFLSAPDRAAVTARAVDTLVPGGQLVAVHWRHPFAEAPSDGDEVHAELRSTDGLNLVVQYEEADFRLDVHESARG